MPLMSKRDAGTIVFCGGSPDPELNYDISGTPEFCLTVLSFCFATLLTVYSLDMSGELPRGYVRIGGMDWHLSVFGVVAFIVFTVASLGMATIRAFSLSAHNLLKGWANDAFLWHRKVRLPVVLAGAMEVAVLASGILLCACTRSVDVLVFAIFGPPILACFVHCWTVWVRNDYELVVWPPEAHTDAPKDDSPSELEVCVHAHVLHSLSCVFRRLHST
jgi:hypothetical protein